MPGAPVTPIRCALPVCGKSSVSASRPSGESFSTCVSTRASASLFPSSMDLVNDMFLYNRRNYVALQCHVILWLYCLTDLLDDIFRGCTRSINTGDAHLFQAWHIFIGDDASYKDLDLILAILFEQLQNARGKRHVRAGQDR